MEEVRQSHIYLSHGFDFSQYEKVTNCARCGVPMVSPGEYRQLEEKSRKPVPLEEARRNMEYFDSCGPGNPARETKVNTRWRSDPTHKYYMYCIHCAGWFDRDREYEVLDGFFDESEAQREEWARGLNTGDKPRKFEQPVDEVWAVRGRPHVYVVNEQECPYHPDVCQCGWFKV